MPPQYKNPVILHLSDLHFGKYRQTIAKATGEHVPTEYVTDKLLNDVENLQPEWRPNFIVVSGDLLEQPPNPLDEEDKAIEFIKKLMKKAKITKDRVIVVPGNHDIIWYKKDSKGRKKEVTKFSEKFSSFRGMNLSKSFSSENDIFCKFYEDYNITFFGFNSNVCTYVHYNAGYVTGDQMEAIEKAFRKKIREARDKSRCQKSIKVAVVHHHILPLPDIDFNEYDIMPDAGTFLWKLIKNNFDIVLHGHKHRPYIYKVSMIDSSIGDKEIYIIGAGSAGSSQKSGRNQYKILKINNDQQSPKEHNIIFQVRAREFHGPDFRDSQLHNEGTLLLRRKISFEEIKHTSEEIEKVQKSIELIQ